MIALTLRIITPREEINPSLQLHNLKNGLKSLRRSYQLLHQNINPLLIDMWVTYCIDEG